MKCKDCRFWKRLSEEDQPFLYKNIGDGIISGEVVIAGECKRRAPSPQSELLMSYLQNGRDEVDGDTKIYGDVYFGNRQPLWPVTDDLEWCGEFEGDR